MSDSGKEGRAGGQADARSSRHSGVGRLSARRPAAASRRPPPAAGDASPASSNTSTVADRPLLRPSLSRRIRTIVSRLSKAYGPRPWKKEDDPVEQLVGTILSQNTNDVNSAAAYEELTRRFRSWDDVLAAPVEQVAEAIRPGGLANQKARTIQRALGRIRQDFGRIGLDALADQGPRRSMEYLTGIPGIGPKTAACVLMFAFGLPVFPVDTHIHRLAIRLGLVPLKTTAVRAQELLQEVCPARLVYPFHVLMITHGRRVCHARRPDCAACPLNDVCPSAFTFDHNRRPRETEPDRWRPPDA